MSFFACFLTCIKIAFPKFMRNYANENPGDCSILLFLTPPSFWECLVSVKFTKFFYSYGWLIIPYCFVTKSTHPFLANQDRRGD